MTDACDARCELYELANAQLEDRLTAEQGTRLEGLVLGSHSLRRQYWSIWRSMPPPGGLGGGSTPHRPPALCRSRRPLIPSAGNDIANHFWQPGLSGPPRYSMRSLSCFARSCSWQRRCFRVFDRLV